MNAVWQSAQPWEGGDPLKSAIVLRGLRAANLHRISRVVCALGQVARVSFQTGATLTARQETFYSPGENPAGPIELALTEADLG